MRGFDVFFSLRKISGFFVAGVALFTALAAYGQDDLSAEPLVKDDSRVKKMLEKSFPKKDSIDFEQVVQRIWVRSQDCSSKEQLKAYLWEIYQNPLELNTASPEALRALHILSLAQQQSLLEHKVSAGPWLSIYELQVVPGLDLETIALLRPFVRVSERFLQRRSSAPNTTQSYIQVRYQRVLGTQQGYTVNKKGEVPYLGSPHGLNLRLHYRGPRHLSMGINAQKGSGETFCWAPTYHQWGAPVCRAHVIWETPDRFQQCILGDYIVGFGQGLLLNTGFGMGKGTDVTHIVRVQNRTVRPHMALSTQAFRGVAGSYRWKNWRLTAYGSVVRLRASLDRDKHTKSPFVAAVKRAERHRTRQDVAKHGAVDEQAVGGACMYQSKNNNAEMGVQGVHHVYSVPIKPDADKHPHRFAGSKATAYSAFGHCVWKNMHCFAEVGTSYQNSHAALAGVLVSLSKYTSLAVLFRHYDNKFYNPLGAGFKTYTSEGIGEQGVYVGGTFSPLQRVVVHTHCDLFQSLALPTQAAIGYAWLGNASYRPVREALLYFQCKRVVKSRQSLGGKPPARGARESGKLKGQYQLSRAWGLKAELQQSRYQEIKKIFYSHGVALGLNYTGDQWVVKGHLVRFSTQGRYNKLYFYEPTLLYGDFGMPAYTGSGTRGVLLLRYKILRLCRLEARWGVHWYDNRKYTGSGNEKLLGPYKNDIKLQAIYSF